MSTELDRLQRWMQSVITHPGTIEEAAEASAAFLPGKAREASDVVTPNRDLSGLDRLDIYARMYIHRLLDCLAEDFSALRCTLGAPRFGALMRDYLSQHPSRHFSLNRLGAGVSDYLRRALEGEAQRDFLVELAALERSVQDVFDAQPSPVLDASALQSLPQERWPDARFRLGGATRLFAFQYPVNPYLQACREDRSVDIPAPRQSWVLVYRKEGLVWRTDLDAARYALLTSMAAGKTLGEALEDACSVDGVDAERVAAEIGDWFRIWTGQHVFATVALD